MLRKEGLMVVDIGDLRVRRWLPDKKISPQSVFQNGLSDSQPLQCPLPASPDLWAGFSDYIRRRKS